MCGKIRVVDGRQLRYGGTQSCGCLQRDRAKYDPVPTKTHGMSRTRIYNIWKGMLARCYSTKADNYLRYGGRGIAVVARWHTFELFLLDMGEPPSIEYSLDRQNNNLGYFKDNCRWATLQEQAANKRRGG